jgi:glycosyltransferase involved in cell wall biosynthesis
MEPITVVIPVGPDPVYLQWLPECVESVINQDYPPDEILFIDDSGGTWMPDNVRQYYSESRQILGSLFGAVLDSSMSANMDFGGIRFDIDALPYISYYKTPWNVGVSDAFNFGVALAGSNLVFMLGSDDVIRPTCLEACVNEYEKQGIEGWYNVTIEMSSDGSIHWIPNHAAMVTKKLWSFTGGFGPSAFAGPDAWMLSILMIHAPERILQVQQDNPLYWVREHEHQDTKKNAWLFGPEMISIRNKETERWKPKE